MTIRVSLLALLTVGCSAVAPATLAPTPAPTPAPPTPMVIYVTPVPAPTITTEPTLAPTPAPTPSLAPGTPTAPPGSPAPSVPPGIEPGIIYFGTERDDETLTIPNPTSTFRRNQKVWWALYLSQYYGVRTVSLVMSRKTAGGETVIYTEDAPINPGWHRLSSWWRFDRLTRRTGDFVMTVYVGNEEIGEGSLTVTK